MKQKLPKIIFFLFVVFCWNNNFSQKLSLEISSYNKKENEVLKKINYKKKHKDTISTNTEIKRVISYLKQSGYFLNSIDDIRKENKKITTYLSLNKKIDSIYLVIPSRFSKLLDNTDKILKMPIHKISLTLTEISNKLGSNGMPFSKVKLKNTSASGKILFADLEIHQSKKRFIDKTLIKGYKNFPKKYIKNYFNIHPESTFKERKVKDISRLSKKLEFIEEIKPPEVLFTKDSTLVYLFLKKRKNNSFDGIVNFTTKEDGGVLFNGNIDFRFNNILNTGEKLHLFWNSIGEERQEFKLSAETDYIFNSKFTPNLNFSIYRQDSTFINTKFISNLYFNINPKSKIGVHYSSESSEDLRKNNNTNTETFQNFFLGLKFQYKTSKETSFFNDIFFLEINPTLGKRTTELNSAQQFKIEASSYYLQKISLRSFLYLRNTTGYLNSNDFLNNEIFRIGGANSIRGFNEQSIFTNNYTLFNTEYRYITSNKSYLYTITDIAFTNPKTYLGFGLGYGVKNTNNLVNLSLAIGKEGNQKLNFNNSKFIISWTNYF